MTEEWVEREAVVFVKAYPNPSSKYYETVCVAAVTEEEGLIRLYPVGFRSLPEDQRFKKYQRVRLRMRKHEKDSRPESYRPGEHSIELIIFLAMNSKQKYAKSTWTNCVGLTRTRTSL